MSRMRFVWHDGRWMPREVWEALRLKAAGVAIVRDFDAPLVHPGDGRLHGSRSTYDAATRRLGLAEVGRTEMNALRSRGQTAQPMPAVRDSLRRFYNS